MNMLVPVAPVRQRPTDAEIIQLVGPPSFTEGGFYVASGRVRQVMVAEDGSVVEALTKGSGARHYHQHITLRQRTSGSLDIRGTCTCPIGFNCKHIAAALIAARRTHRLGPGEQAALEPPADEPALPAELGAWLKDICEDQQPDSRRKSTDTLYLVLYVLSLNANPRGIDSLAIQPFKAELRKGRQCAERQLPPERWSGPKLPAGGPRAVEPAGLPSSGRPNAGRRAAGDAAAHNRDRARALAIRNRSPDFRGAGAIRAARLANER